jgi:hypothetical protein
LKRYKIFLIYFNIFYNLFYFAVIFFNSFYFFLMVYFNFELVCWIFERLLGDPLVYYYTLWHGWWLPLLFYKEHIDEIWTYWLTSTDLSTYLINSIIYCKGQWHFYFARTGKYILIKVALELRFTWDDINFVSIY